MPSAGLGGLGARGGVRVWTSGGALHASTGSRRGRRGGKEVPRFLLVFLLVLGQEEVQEEGHDEADGVGRLQEDDRRRPVRVRALVVLGAAPVWKSTGESGGARREILASAQSSTRRCRSCTCAPARHRRPGTSCTSCSGAKTQCCAAGSSRRRTPRRRPRRGAVPWRRRCRGPSTA